MKKIFLLFTLLLIVPAWSAKIQVGLLKARENLGAEGIRQLLAEQKNLDVTELTELNEENLKNIQVLLISRSYPFQHRELLRNKVLRDGMGILLTHEASGSGRTIFTKAAAGTFPEIAAPRPGTEGDCVSSRQMCVINPDHPVTSGVPLKYLSQYSDHAILFPVNDSLVLVEDSPQSHDMTHRSFNGTQRRWDKYKGGRAVLAAGTVGKGRVILYGALPGFNHKDREEKPTGAEARLLLNSITWLSGKGETGTDAAAPASPSKYAAVGDIVIPEFDKDAIAVHSPEVAASPASTRSPEPITLNIPVTGKVAIIEFEVPEKYGTPTGIMINGKTYPLQWKTDKNRATAFFMFAPASAHLSGQLVYTALPPDITVKVKEDGSSAEITTPEVRLIVASEKGKAGLQFLQVLNWDYHHTWQGLERNSYSAPILRLSDTLWPFWKKPYSIYHEQGYPEPDFNWELKSTTNHGVYVDLTVGDGSIRVYRNGQIVLKNFADNARLSTWGFDYYLCDGKRYIENAGHDLPFFKGKVTAVKTGCYAMGGDFEMTGKLGITGMSPGIMRQLKHDGTYLYATTDVDKIDAYAVPPVTVKANLAPGAREEPIMLPERKLVFRKLQKERHGNQFFHQIPVPLEIYRDMLPAQPQIVSWKIDSPQIRLVSPAEYPLTDPNNEDSSVHSRLLLTVKDPFKPGSFKARVSGKDQSGKTVVEFPLSFDCRVSVPLGIFTYSSQWTTQAAKCPPSQWPKLIRSIAMSGMDYVIHGISDQNKKTENTDTVSARIKRYGLWWCIDFSGYPGRYLRHNKGINTREFKAVQFPPQLDENLIAELRKYRPEPNIIAWYLCDETPAGEPGNESELTAGYQIANHMYDLAAANLPPDALKINLITTHFTSRESWKKYLKSDVFSYDPYYNHWTHLGWDVKHTVETVNTPKNKPLWTTIRSCGPTWYDCLDDWFDIRRQTSAAWIEGSDSINYFMFSHWLSNMERNAWYTVWPGPKGPVASPRRQILDYAANDVQLFNSVEYLLDQYRGDRSSDYRKLFEKSKKLATQGNYYQARVILDDLMEQLNK